MTRPLVIDVKRMTATEAARLRERLGIMLGRLDDPDPRHDVSIDQSGPTTPIHADTRGFGLSLQVHPRSGDPRRSLRDFLVRATEPTTLWAEAGAYEAVRSATHGAWETVRALVGDLVDANLSDRGLGSAPRCMADACLGPRMEHVHPSTADLVRSAVGHAFADVPDVAWACSLRNGGRVRDFRIGDHSIAFSEVAQPDPVSRLRALASWHQARDGASAA